MKIPKCLSGEGSNSHRFIKPHSTETLNAKKEIDACTYLLLLYYYYYYKQIIQ